MEGLSYEALGVISPVAGAAIHAATYWSVDCHWVCCVITWTKNKLHHPDILTGILSLRTILGPANILHGAFVTWTVKCIRVTT